MFDSLPFQNIRHNKNGELKVMKKLGLYLGIIFCFEILFCQQSVFAQDIWVYGNDDTSYWIDDDTIEAHPRATEIQYRVALKTVYKGVCTDNVTWSFGTDEGYVFATNRNQNYGLVIYAYPKNSGSCKHIADRPELIATYFWLQNNTYGS